MILEFEFEVEEDGLPPGIVSLEIEQPSAVPRVGEYVMVEGVRKVLRVTHYYGVPVANGRKDAHDWARNRGLRALSGPTVIYVRLGKRQKGK